VRLEHYLHNGSFPKGTLFARLIDGELVTVKILSVADGEYGLDIQCEDEDIAPGIVSPVKFAEVIKWHMQPEHDETPAAPHFAPELAVGIDIPLHGQNIRVLSISGDVVQFQYTKNGERRSMARGVQWLTPYLAHGMLPKGAQLTRFVEGSLVTVEIISAIQDTHDCTYGIAVDCDNEEIKNDLDTTVSGKALAIWYAECEVPEVEAASQFPAHPGYAPDEDSPDYAAGRKAALAEVMEQSQEVSRLKHETDDFHETIAILRDELEAYKTANARLEAKGRIVNGQRYAYLADTHILIGNVNQRCRDEELEVCHFQYDATGLKLSVVYRKPVEPEPLPAPQPTHSSSVGNPTHGAGQGVPGITIIHKDAGERKGVALRHNRPLFEEPGKTKRIPHLQQSNQRVAQFMTGLKERSDERLEILARDFANRSPFKLGVIHHDQSI
jgi:hypothetical protein